MEVGYPLRRGCPLGKGHAPKDAIKIVFHENSGLDCCMWYFGGLGRVGSPLEAMLHPLGTRITDSFLEIS
jgi:hypothetical protein